MKCTCRIKSSLVGDYIKKCPLCKAAPELYRLLDLIVMEFKSDPMSVQLFDLEAIVEPAKAILVKLEEGETGVMGKCNSKITEIRFVIEEELTECYVAVEAEGDCPIGVQGWHHKTYSASRSCQSILDELGQGESYLLWPLDAPPDERKRQHQRESPGAQAYRDAYVDEGDSTK